MSSLVQSANLTNCKAFNRRRDFVLDMTFRPGCSVTENWDYNWCVMRQLTNDGDVRKTFDKNGYMDAVKEIIFTYRRFRRFSEHFELTHAEQRKISVLSRFVDGVCEAETYFDKLLDKVSYGITGMLEKEYFGMKFKYLFSYLNERFPFVNMLLFVILYAMVYSVHQMTVDTFTHSMAFHLLGAGAVISFFFNLRVFDEMKDYKLDLINHPQRVLQSGKINLTTLQFLALLGFLVHVLWQGIYSKR